MKAKLTREEIEMRFNAINALEGEALTEADRVAIQEAEAEDPSDTISLAEYKKQKEYSGRLMIRIPKELHKQLVQDARENGVSLNQYALYKLAR